MSCRIRRRGGGLPSTKVPLGICTGGCALNYFGCRVANLAAALSASFIRPFSDDLHQTSHTSPLPCTILPTSSGVLWRDVRLADSVVTRGCTSLLLLSQRNLVSALSSEQTFEGSQAVAPGPSRNTEILPRRWWLFS